MYICIFTCPQQQVEGFAVCWLWRTGRPEGLLWTALCCGTLGAGVSAGSCCGSRIAAGKVIRAPWSCWCGRSSGPGHHPLRQVGRSGPELGVPSIPGVWPQFCNIEKLMLPCINNYYYEVFVCLFSLRLSKISIKPTSKPHKRWERNCKNLNSYLYFQVRLQKYNQLERSRKTFRTYPADFFFLSFLFCLSQELQQAQSIKSLSEQMPLLSIWRRTARLQLTLHTLPSPNKPRQTPHKIMTAKTSLHLS